MTLEYRPIASGHAVGRYIERVRPLLTEKAARDELERLLYEEGVKLEGVPSWLPPRDLDEDNADEWIAIGDTGIVCPLQRHRVLTVLIRAGMSPRVRERRTEKKKARKARRRRGQSSTWLGVRDINL